VFWEEHFTTFIIDSLINISSRAPRLLQSDLQLDGFVLCALPKFFSYFLLNLRVVGYIMLLYLCFRSVQFTEFR